MTALGAAWGPATWHTAAQVQRSAQEHWGLRLILCSSKLFWLGAPEHFWWQMVKDQKFASWTCQIQLGLHNTKLAQLLSPTLSCRDTLSRNSAHLTWKNWVLCGAIRWGFALKYSWGLFQQKIDGRDQGESQIQWSLQLAMIHIFSCYLSGEGYRAALWWGEGQFSLPHILNCSSSLWKM